MRMIQVNPYSVCLFIDSIPDFITHHSIISGSDILMFDHSRSKTTATIQSIVCNCLNATKRSFCINMWQWMKYGSATSLKSQIGSQLSEQQQVKAIQSDQKCKHQQARFWPLYFGMHKVFCPSVTLRKEEPSIANIVLHYLCIWRKKSPKNGHKWRRKKKALSPKQFTALQVNCNNIKTTWIALWIGSTPTLFSRADPQWLLAICRPQKNASRKEV